jgi:hypothetical protein
MPVPAAGLADVLVGDAEPLVRGGILRHLLDQQPALLLGPGVLAQAAADVADPAGEAVPDDLELIHGEQPGPAARGGNPEVDPRAGERRAEQASQLRLHQGDLAAQVGA